MNFTIKIADKVIAISSLYKFVAEYCKGYISNDTSDMMLQIAQTDIDREREKSEQEDKKEGIPIRQFPDEYLETLAVYRKIAEKMLDYDVILFHGSVVAVDGIGYLFTAKSGTGKSTHTRLWRELFGTRAVMINDDKPLIHISKNGIIVYGTPWNGKHRLSTNTSVPLKAICILERSEENHIEKVPVNAVYHMLIQQVYRSNDPQKLLKALQLIDILSENVDLYKLGCNMDISAAKTAYNMMKG